MVAMGTFIFGTLGGLVIAGCAAIYARQTLIEEAQSETDGHF
ncbi:hypothetical protein GOFOIKOB_4985 [Methylobacterium tardum]|jgi:hypothetical protein|uniref:Uncharacterized protein n=1 Tax=Methylobacterium tardum TaxID=374432 RepID=A0AA37WUA4_9HYPH|nr:hypothetical protein GOFOIKOB_4985 [Methylobacterium tardum]GLS70858.1 hypothetical protein GCM10007890_28710 [Methylobacterium tardum]